MTDYNKKYAKTENGKRINKINKLKQRGLICNEYEDYVTIYYHWLVSTNCEKCNCEFTKSNFKCMDHCHNTGQYRNILCHSCNNYDNSNNTSGIPNISYNKTYSTWRYCKKNNYKQHRRNFKTKEEAIEYKKQYESILT